MAVQIIKHSNSQTLPQAMAWVVDFSERSDAVSRLGLRKGNDREEMPMEIAALPPTTSPISAQETTTQMLGKVLRSQDKLMTKISKLNAAQNFGHGSSSHSAGSNDKRHGNSPPQTSTSLPNLSEDGRPRCFLCNQYGHSRRNCRARNEWQAAQQPPPYHQQGN